MVWVIVILVQDPGLYRPCFMPMFGLSLPNAYATPVWVFTVVDAREFPDGDLIRHGYKGIFRDSERLYYRAGRLILGALSTAHGDSVLVNLRWLPFVYRIIHLGLMWYLKIVHGRVDSLLVTNRSDCIAADELNISSSYGAEILSTRFSSYIRMIYVLSSIARWR